MDVRLDNSANESSKTGDERIAAPRLCCGNRSLRLEDNIYQGEGCCKSESVTVIGFCYEGDVKETHGGQPFGVVSHLIAKARLWA